MKDLIEYEKQLRNLILFIDQPKGYGKNSVKENYVIPYYDTTYLDRNIRISKLKDKIIKIREKLGLDNQIDMFVIVNNNTIPNSPNEVYNHLNEGFLKVENNTKNVYDNLANIQIPKINSDNNGVQNIPGINNIYKSLNNNFGPINNNIYQANNNFISKEKNIYQNENYLDNIKKSDSSNNNENLNKPQTLTSSQQILQFWQKLQNKQNINTQSNDAVLSNIQNLRKEEKEINNQSSDNLQNIKTIEKQTKLISDISTNNIIKPNVDTNIPVPINSKQPSSPTLTNNHNKKHDDESITSDLDSDSDDINDLI